MSTTKRKHESLKAFHIFERLLLRRIRSASAVLGCDVALYKAGQIVDYGKPSIVRTPNSLAIIDHTEQTKQTTAKVARDQNTHTVVFQEVSQINTPEINAAIAHEHTNVHVMVGKDADDSSFFLTRILRYAVQSARSISFLRWGHINETLPREVSAKAWCEHLCMFAKKHHFPQPYLKSLQALQQTLGNAVLNPVVIKDATFASDGAHVECRMNVITTSPSTNAVTEFIREVGAHLIVWEKPTTKQGPHALILLLSLRNAAGRPQRKTPKLFAVLTAKNTATQTDSEPLQEVS